MHPKPPNHLSVLRSTLPVSQSTRMSRDLLPRYFSHSIPSSIFSTGLFEALLAQVTGPIFGLKNLRRAPGNSGRFNRVITTESGVKEHRFVDGKGRLLPYPTSLVVEVSLF